MVALINEANGQSRADVLTFVEEKFERRLSEEVAKLDGKIAEVKVNLSEVKADLIRWMFIFWVGQIGALLGILFAFFRR